VAFFMLCRKLLSGWHVPGRRFKRQRFCHPTALCFDISSALEEITDVFKGLEDVIVKFPTTGKLSFKDLAKTIDAEIARMGAKSLIGEGTGVSGLWIFVSGHPTGALDSHTREMGMNFDEVENGWKTPPSSLCISLAWKPVGSARADYFPRLNRC
jgi:hypothetical protein